MTTGWKMACALGLLVASISIMMSALLYIDNHSARLARAKNVTAADQRLCREIGELRRAARVRLRLPPCASLQSLRPGGGAGK